MQLMTARVLRLNMCVCVCGQAHKAAAGAPQSVSAVAARLTVENGEVFRELVGLLDDDDDDGRPGNGL